jgi:hypothetical protein
MRPSHDEPDDKPGATELETVAHNSHNGAGPEDLDERLRQDLSPEHLRSLRTGSGISPEDILARGYFTATDPEQLRELGFAEYQLNVPALIVPVHGVEDGPLFYRVRPDRPREDAAKPSKVVKYEQPKGTGIVLDVPPRAHPMLSDTGKRLWIVEGEKKADSLITHGECAVALLGVWAWKRDGRPLPDWDEIRIVERQVLVVFDSDAQRKVEVKGALLALAEYLKARGARVKLVKLPDKEDGAKQGVDDFLVAGGSVEDMIELSEVFTGMEVADPEWPVLAEEAFHGPAGEVVRAIEPNTESDPAGLLATFIAEVGNVIGRGAHFVIEDDEHYCKVWPVLVGQTGKARKGTGKKRIDRLMREVDGEWCKLCTVTGLSSGEGLINRVRDPVFVDKDDGLEVKDPGAEDKRLLVEEPEFASCLTVMRRDGNTLSMVLRNAWDNRPLQTLTKNSPQRASDTHISVVGHVTEGELRRHLTEEKLGGGTGNRFLFVCVRRSKMLPHGGERDIFPEDLVRRLQEAVEFGKERREIPISEEIEEVYGYSAMELWQWVYADLSSGKPGLFGAVVGRAEAQVRRIAIVYAVLDLSPVVRVPHLLAALAIWQYSEASARRIFGDRTGDALADEVLEVLKNTGDEGMTRSEIYELFGRNQRRERLSAVLRDLRSQGRARMEKDKPEGPGRPTERWFIADA